MKLEILFENDQYVFVNKPSGMLTIPDRHDAEMYSVSSLLAKQYGKLFTVHRLDKDTSGCICFAKDEETHRYTSLLFENRKVEKYYSGIVHGSPQEKTGLIEQALMEHPTKKGKMVINQKMGKASSTSYEVMESFGLFSQLKYQLHTGRMHQIRVHTAHIGHPIVCDPLYGDGKEILLSTFKKKFNLSKEIEQEKPLMNRLALHAMELKFLDNKKCDIHVIAPIPRDMNAMLNQCRKWLK
jgi:23S rRNA pseudouridine955/2504/2580 synthase/23S rRNA pseudouridine1911/1915/1917 synthase